MSEELFTKKSLEKIKSPDSLNDTIKVANPSVWLILTAIIVILIGAVVWCIFGRIENSFKTGIEVHYKEGLCDFTYDEFGAVQKGMIVRIGSAEGVIEAIDKNHGTATVSIDVPDGVYTCEIITESIQPITFITN